jgi:hypothetical protein
VRSSLSPSFLCFLSSLGRRFSSRAKIGIFHARICVYLFELTAARAAARGKIEATRAIALTRVIIAHLSFSFFLSLCSRVKNTAVSSPRAVNSTDLHNPGAT